VSAEAHRRFDCFGGTATIHVQAADAARAEESADASRRHLLRAHDRLSRFIEDSELSRLNADPRAEVPATPLTIRLAAAAKAAGAHSGGLVDATLLGDLERAGYRKSMSGGGSIALAEALSGGAERAPARAHPARRWRSIGVDEAAGTIIRPPGLRIDSGGIAKGLVADLVAATLRDRRAFAVDCCGDIRIGGSAGRDRAVLVEDPFGGDPVHELRLSDGAVATSGIGRRCWVEPGGGVAHHILDPFTGEPAFTGIVQATAIAPSALLAETYAKAALLSGPDRAARRLPHGGVLVLDNGEVELVDAERPVRQAVPAP
jgi:thiamine biosynthesis lipoprotein